MSNCITTSTTTCLECTHPFEYILELVYQETVLNVNSTSYGKPVTTLSTLLEKGIILPNCGKCCPNCDKYGLASIETILKLFEAIGGSFTCCLNLYASVEKYLGFAEAVGYTQAVPPAGQIGNSGDYSHYKCCNDFHDCMDNLICTFSKYSPNTMTFIIDRLLDKGVVEYDSINYGCNINKSSICLLVELLNKYFGNQQSNVMMDMFEEILNKGIVISCENGITIVSSQEKYLNWLEVVG